MSKHIEPQIVKLGDLLREAEKQLEEARVVRESANIEQSQRESKCAPRIDWNKMKWRDRTDAQGCEAWSVFADCAGDYGFDVDASGAAFDGVFILTPHRFAFRIDDGRGVRFMVIVVDVEWDERPRLVSATMEVRRV